MEDNNELVDIILNSIESSNTDIDFIKKTFNHNPDLLYYRDQYDDTWLHITSEYTIFYHKKDDEILEILKCFIGQSYGSIDINFKNRNDKTAIYRLVKNGRYECVNFLIKNGADIHDVHPYNSTLIACSYICHPYIKYQMVKLLLEHDVDPNEQNSEGYTLLHLLFLGTNYSHDTIKLLLNYNAKIDILNIHNETCMKIIYDSIIIYTFANETMSEFIKDTCDIIYCHIINKLKKVLAKEKIKKFLLKKIVLCPKSKYIQRLVKSF
jgi:hypothetical protein